MEDEAFYKKESATYKKYINRLKELGRSYGFATDEEEASELPKEEVPQAATSASDTATQAK